MFDHYDDYRQRSGWAAGREMLGLGDRSDFNACALLETGTASFIRTSRPSSPAITRADALS